MKVLLQYSMLVLVHVFLFFVWPRNINEPYIELPQLIIVYLLECGYFWASALQIQHGYPQVRMVLCVSVMCTYLRTRV